MSEPWPPAFIAGRRPPSPGPPRAHSRPCSPAAAAAPGHDGQLGARSGPHAWSPSISTPVEPGPRTDDEAGEAGVGHEQVRALAEDQQRHTSGVGAASARCTATSRPRSSTSTSTRGRRPRPGRWCAPRAGVTQGPRPEQRRRRRRARRAARRSVGRAGAHHGVVACSSSGSDVRSPAPRVRHRSPGASSAATWRRSSARPAT